jgi:hypothetical protein
LQNLMRGLLQFAPDVGAMAMLRYDHCWPVSESQDPSQ